MVFDKQYILAFFAKSYCVVAYTKTGYIHNTILVYCCQGDIMRLKQLREEKGISQLKLAMDLSVNQNTISRYETGVREADYAMLIKIAEYFDVSVDYLLGRTENKKFLK